MRRSTIRGRVRVVSLAALAALLAVDARFAQDPAAAGELLLPERGKRLVQIDAPRRPESVQDGATVYLNDHQEQGRYRAFGTAAPRRPDWGESLTLVANDPAPLEIRSIEFSIQVSTTSNVVAQFDFWDQYDTAASPVNVGYLGSREGNYGLVTANTTGFYSQVELRWDAAPIVPSDPEIFVQFKFKTTTGAGAPLNLAVQPIADVFEGGPNLGTSPNDVYVDQNADGVFTFSAPNAGDRRVVSSIAQCGPDDCQTNWHLHLRGAPNPDVVEAGMDLLETSGAGSSVFLSGFGPAQFDLDDAANSCVPPGLFTSDPVTAPIVLRGVPLMTDSPGVLAPADTVVRRLAPFSLSEAGFTATIPIRVAALRLESVAPFTVTYDGGQNPTQWNVAVCLSDTTPQPTGSMTVTRASCVFEGGTYDAVLPVLPRLIFTPVGAPPNPACTSPITLDYGPVGLPPILLTTTGGHYLNDPPPGIPVIQEPFAGDQVDGDCNGFLDAALLPATSNFIPGLRVPRCQGDPTCGATLPPAKRLTLQAAPEMTHGVLPAGAPDPNDADQDGLADIADNCPHASNPLQSDADDDSVGDACDRCPGLCDPSQVDDDGDSDGVGDACDNCPSLSNPAQENADGDDLGDACDCAPFDPANEPAGPVTGLRFAAPLSDKTTIEWTFTPGVTSWDVVRGNLAALPVGPGGADETCFGGLASAQLVDTAVPTGAFFYVVRSSNGCGTGDYGRTHQNPGPAANGMPRSTTTCP